MINDKPSKSAKQSAISGAWIECVAILLLLIGQTARAQERPLELSLGLEPFNTHYEENYDIQPGVPGGLNGNSFTALSAILNVVYHGREQMHVPVFLAVEPELPLVTLKGTEVGHRTQSGITTTTQTENVAHVDLGGTVKLGYEILPFFQPYVQAEHTEFTSRRTGEMDGQDDGTFTPGDNQDYKETVSSTHLGFGVLGRIALTTNADWRIRYDVGYEIPQKVAVSDTYFGSGEWGQGATGYTVLGSLALELPFAGLSGFAEHNGFMSLGFAFSDRHWSGDGRVATEIYQSPRWPANTTLHTGAFIGVGLFL